MLQAEWLAGYAGLHGKADAQKVAEEIISIGDEASPQEIVDKARDESTELHKCFEWNNDIAADKYRIYQARQVVCHLVIKQAEDEERAPIRMFYKTGIQANYKSIELILKNEDEYNELLKRAWAELHSIKAKYNRLQELEEIFALIP